MWLHGYLGLKKYFETVLLPRNQLKVGKGPSLSSLRQFLIEEGFEYTTFKKGIFFDGHDRLDVKEDLNQRFLPTMATLARRLVGYVVCDVEKESPSVQGNFVEQRLVLCAHDEMTAQANDSAAKEWVFMGQHKLRKKGAGRGIHQSDIICSTVGWLKEASQTLEYGKNYDGYWNGELFIKQVRQF
jgi:hypothetical protein